MNEILNQWLATGPMFMLATVFAVAMISASIKKLADRLVNKD